MTSEPIKLSSEKLTKNGWVNFGEDNDYFDYLLHLYNNSAIHGAITLSKAEQVYGSGLDALKKESNIIGYNEIKSLLKPKDLKSFILDYIIFGNATLQVIWSRDKTKIAKVDYIPVKNLRPSECDENGDINEYYYSDDFKQYRKEQYKPIPYTAFNIEKRGGIQILWVKNNNPSLFYFGLPDYIHALNYIELDVVIGDYYLNYASNGFSPTMFIQFNNGTPTEEEQIDIERRLHKKFSGEHGQKIMLGFNDSPETAATITTIQQSDGDKQYELLQATVANRIITGHRIVSPTLFGFRDGGGLGNNADELYQAQELTHKLVISAFQEEITDEVVKPISRANGVSLEWYFERRILVEQSNIKTNQVPTNYRPSTDQVTAKKTQLSKETCGDACDFTDDEGNDMLKQLADLGEMVDEEEWELIDSAVVEDADAEDDFLKGFEMNVQLADYSSFAEPDARSSQDKALFKVRYTYSPIRNSANSRQFCKDMERLAKNKLVFRKEDISKMSFSGVNNSFGHKGQNYSLFKYKGGPYCHHYWRRLIYKRKRDKGKFLPNEGLENDKRIVESTARKEGFTPAKNPSEVAKKPVNMPNHGHHPNFIK